jgi:AraC family transcriptional regulator, positive regulator of tynA and feaB
MSRVVQTGPLHTRDALKRYVYSSSDQMHDKHTSWRNIVEDVYAPLDLDIVNPLAFHGKIHLSTIARLDLSEFVSDGEIAHRRRQHVSSDKEDFFLFELSKAGASTYIQYGRECKLTPAHFTLLYSADPYSFCHEERVNSLCLKIPSIAMRARVSDPHALCGSAKRVVPGMSQIMADLLMSLSSESHLLDATSAPVIEANLLDMIGLVLGTHLQRTAVGGTTARWAIHKRAVAVMREALGQPDLSPETIAAAIGVSVRYLHRVFEDAEQTASETLLAMRLGKSMTELRDPAMHPLSIKEIAFRNGFRSQSHFASSFRAKFGVTPKEARLGEGPEGHRPV